MTQTPLPGGAYDIVVGIPTVRRPTVPGEPLLCQVVRSLLEAPRPEGFRLMVLVYNVDREPERHEAVQQLPELARELGAEALLRVEQPAARDAVRPYEVEAERDPEIPEHPLASHPWHRWQARLACDRILLLERVAEFPAWGYLMLEDDCTLSRRAGWRRLAREGPAALARRGGILRLRSYGHFSRAAALLAPKSGATSILFDPENLRDYIAQIHHSMRHQQGVEPIDHLLDARGSTIDAHRLFLFRHIGGHNSTNAMRAPNFNRSLFAEDWETFKTALVFALKQVAPASTERLLQARQRWRGDG